MLSMLMFSQKCVYVRDVSFDFAFCLEKDYNFSVYSILATVKEANELCRQCFFLSVGILLNMNIVANGYKFNHFLRHTPLS